MVSSILIALSLHTSQGITQSEAIARASAFRVRAATGTTDRIQGAPLHQGSPHVAYDAEVGWWFVHFRDGLITVRRSDGRVLGLTLSDTQVTPAWDSERALSPTALANLVAQYARAVQYGHSLQVFQVCRGGQPERTFKIDAWPIHDGVRAYLTLPPHFEVDHVTGRLHRMIVSLVVPDAPTQLQPTVSYENARITMVNAILQQPSVGAIEEESESGLFIWKPKQLAPGPINELDITHSTLAVANRAILAYVGFFTDLGNRFPGTTTPVVSWRAFVDAQNGRLLVLERWGAGGGVQSTASLKIQEIGKGDLDLYGQGHAIKVKGASWLPIADPKTASDWSIVTMRRGRLWLRVEFSLATGLARISSAGKPVLYKPNDALRQGFRKAVANPRLIAYDAANYAASGQAAWPFARAGARG